MSKRPTTPLTLGDKVVTGILSLFLEAWYWMVGLGVVHSHWHQVPAVGYWTAMVLVFFFSNGSNLSVIRQQLDRLAER